MANPFRQRATGGEHALDKDHVLTALGLLMEPTQTFELRTLPSGRSRICTGSDLPAAVDAAWELSDEKGLYFCLNPVRPDLIGAAKDRDVLTRRWMLIDVDTKRSDKDSNASEAEKAIASNIVGALLDYLCGVHGWPHPLVIDSGNGWHLLCRIDLPNDKLSQQLIRSILKALDDKFKTAEVGIDTAVHNAARISKLPGSWARKGPSTEERPHRLARVWYDPGTTVVSLEQLKSVASLSEANRETNNPFLMKATNGNGLEPYVKSAIERECGRLMMTSDHRNDQLNKCAFALGQLSWWPEMDQSLAKSLLKRAGLQCGLGETETDKTIESGWNSGTLSPRTRPAEQTNGVHKTIDPGEKLTIGLDEFETEKVDWIYENRVAPGFISIFAGRTGLGKSFVTCDIIAKLSQGCSAPYSRLVHAPIRALFISEDSPKVVIGPRLIELGADRSMVRFMTFDAMAQYTLADTDMLGRAYEETGRPRLIVIDPPANFLGKIDEHKNAEVRSTLKLLSAWLETHRVACIFIMHINKAVGKGLDAVERIVGSVAWGTSARITLAFTKDPNVAGQLLFGGTKNNLGPLAETVAYKIVKTDVLATVQWLGQVDTTMEDAMNSVKKKSRGQCAVEWLTSRFREKREWESDTLREDADNNGISKNALWSPEAQALPILKRQRINAAGDRAWFWIAETGWPAEKEQRESEECGNV